MKSSDIFEILNHRDDCFVRNAHAPLLGTLGNCWELKDILRVLGNLCNCWEL